MHHYLTIKKSPKEIFIAPGLFSSRLNVFIYISFDFLHRKALLECVYVERGRIVATVFGGLTVAFAWRKAERNKL